MILRNCRVSVNSFYGWSIFTLIRNKIVVTYVLFYYVNRIVACFFFFFKCWNIIPFSRVRGFYDVDHDDHSKRRLIDWVEWFFSRYDRNQQHVLGSSCSWIIDIEYREKKHTCYMNARACPLSIEEKLACY